MAIGDPYHPGEARLQELAGERDIALLNGRAVAQRIVAPAFRFLAQQSLFVLGAASAENECEATVLFGPRGFLAAHEGGALLALALDAARDRHADPVLRDLAPGRRVGGLAIDLATRRRLRINGRVRTIGPSALAIEVEESFANCPKYIQKRILELTEAPTSTELGSDHGSALGTAQRGLVRSADTFFVVTVNPRGHADASHRGGEPGFVRIDDDGLIRIPDYPGNSMFSTLGNLLVHPQAALVFWDFEAARLLHVAGDAAIALDVPDPDGLTGGTGRFWTLRPIRWREQRVPVPFRMRLVERSPFNPLPGT